VSNDRHVTDVGLAVHEGAELVLVSTTSLSPSLRKIFIAPGRFVFNGMAYLLDSEAVKNHVSILVKAIRITIIVEMVRDGLT
jgi:hypothetical protein